MNKIKRIDENKKIEIFNNIVDAAKSVDTKMELWKVQMLIVDAINHKKRAFKYNWQKVK